MRKTLRIGNRNKQIITAGNRMVAKKQKNTARSFTIVGGSGKWQDEKDFVMSLVNRRFSREAVLGKAAGIFCAASEGSAAGACGPFSLVAFLALAGLLTNRVLPPPTHEIK